VQSLVRGGFRVCARDIRLEAEAAAVASGASARPTPAALDAGYGDEDDAALLKFYRDRGALR
jgi:hypothetical protein